MKRQLAGWPDFILQARQISRVCEQGSYGPAGIWMHGDQSTFAHLLVGELSANSISANFGTNIPL